MFADKVVSPDENKSLQCRWPKHPFGRAGHHATGNESLREDLKAAAEIRNDRVLALDQCFQPKTRHFLCRLRFPLLVGAAASYFSKFGFGQPGAQGAYPYSVVLHLFR